jgi:hypothetical protein
MAMSLIEDHSRLLVHYIVQKYAGLHLLNSLSFCKQNPFVQCYQLSDILRDPNRIIVHK